MPHTLRFCSWNIQVGMKRSQLLDVIHGHPDFRALDLLALQEASAHATIDDAARIASSLGADYEHYQHTYHFHKSRAQANALVWNSKRVRFDQIDHFQLPQRHQVRISRGERALLQRVAAQIRVNLVADGTWAGYSLRVCTAHLDVVGFAFKRAQFNAILADLRKRPPLDLTILAGDFNTFSIAGHPNWDQLKASAAELGMRAISDKIPWTQMVRLIRLKQKLDEIFAGSTQLLETRVWTLDIGGSDHIPIFADLTLE